MINSFDKMTSEFLSMCLESFGENCFEKNIILRDATGRLTLVIREDYDKAMRREFDERVRKEIPKYIDLPSATPTELFMPELAEATGLIEQHTLRGVVKFVPVISNNIVGNDWNRVGNRFSLQDKVTTFFSCKGGVGRSTALAVTAAHLSSQGSHVLIIDLDIEAPGIGEILLGEEQMPKFGVIDFLTELNFGDVDERYMRSCIGTSELTAGHGLVEILPAVGSSSRSEPFNVINKISYSLTDTEDSTGRQSFLKKVQRLVELASEVSKPDYILIDARAGLSEATAGALMGLGGNVLMFGLDTLQTFECYRYLFAQLHKFALTDQSASWRENIKMVHAQSRSGAAARAQFRDRAYSLFSEFLYDEAEPGDFEAFNFDVNDDSAPHFALTIPYDADFSEFDPKLKRDQLSDEFIARSFGAFLAGVDKLRGGN
jgi:Mrp family chromosome partitioning ATPase